MTHKIFVLFNEDGYILYLDNLLCAKFFSSLVDDSYYLRTLTIDSDRLSSNMILDKTQFLKKIEYDYSNLKKDILFVKEFNELKMKLREQTINKILNE